MNNTTPHTPGITPHTLPLFPDGHDSRDEDASLEFPPHQNLWPQLEMQVRDNLSFMHTLSDGSMKLIVTSPPL